MDLVSVIITTYNRSNKIYRAIESVKNQTYENIEIIVIDDNHPFSTQRKLTSEVISNFNKINYIKHNLNSGGSAARNTGLKNACGKYISFLDDDDYFRETKIEEQVKYIKNHNCDSVSCGRVHGNNVIIPKLSENPLEDILTQRFFPYTSTLMFKASAIERVGYFDESFPRHQDLEYLMRFLKANNMCLIEKPLVFIDSSDRSNMLHADELLELKRKFLDTFNEQILLIDSYKKGFKAKVYSLNYIIILFEYIKEKRFKDAMSIYLYMTRQYPIVFNLEFYLKLLKYVVFKLFNRRIINASVTLN